MALVVSARARAAQRSSPKVSGMQGSWLVIPQPPPQRSFQICILLHFNLPMTTGAMLKAPKGAAVDAVA